MRFIHTGDIHLGATPESKRPWAANRGDEIWNTLERLIKKIKIDPVDLLIIAGDMFHRQPLLRELKEVDYLFSTIPDTKVVLCAGNHDAIKKGSFYDGTVLQAARETKKILVPIIGVNLGTVGYMTEIEPSGLEEALERLIRDDYKKERRMMLNGKVCCADGTVSEGWALNDIVISRSGTLQIIEFNIYVNGQLLNHYKADGMIVTTPTGSTGYNLSAGGPLVEPKAKLITLTPICPHSLNQRSIILSPEDEIVIEIPGGREGKSQTVEANYDGSHKVTMCTGDHIRIVQSEKITEFIQLNQVSFLDVLHRKMRDS